MGKKRKKKKKSWVKYVLVLGLFFLMVINGAWATEKLSGLEKARRRMVKNPNDIEARLEWWKGLVETEYWEEALKEEVYFEKMYEALGDDKKEKVLLIRGTMKREYPGYMEVDLLMTGDMENEGSKDWWIKKAKMEMKREEYEKALESIKKAREMDEVDEEIERIERELS